MSTTHEGNLTNTPPKAYVTNQINLRQELLGKSNLKNSPEILDVYNNRGVFTRICSSIELDTKLADELQVIIDDIKKIDASARTTSQQNELRAAEINKKSVASERLKSANFSPTLVESLKGREFARNFIIQGTVMKNPFGSSNLREIYAEGAKDKDGNDLGGLESPFYLSNPTNKQEGGLGGFDSPFNGAYGWGSLKTGGDGFGYDPIPGITSATVKYLNKGAVTESTINIKLYNRRQFQLFDLLYLRPGFSVLFEFGWTKYIKSGLDPVTNAVNSINSNSNISSKSEIQHAKFNTYAFKEFFRDKPDPQRIFDAIEIERMESEGNYEAVFGIISNFDWTFNEDGTYDCTIKLMGHGSVITGLAINQQSGDELRIAKQRRYNTTETTNEETGLVEITKTSEKVPFEIPDASKSALGADLYGVIKKYGFINNWPSSNYDGFKFKRYYLEGFKDINGQEANIYFDNGLLGISLQNQEGHTSYGEEGDQFVQNPITYMLFGAFLALLQSKYLLYAYEEGSNQNPKPITNFDFNFLKKNNDGNIATRDSQGNDLYIQGSGNDGSIKDVYYLPDNLNNDKNYMLTAPGVFSADPSVCLVNWTNVTKEIADITGGRSRATGGIDLGGGITTHEILGGIAKKNGIYYKDKMEARSFPVFNHAFDKIVRVPDPSQPGQPTLIKTESIQQGEEIDVNNITDVPKDSFLGKIANIYVNVNMLTKLAGQASDGQKLFMDSFLNSLLTEIQGAFGGINQLRAETRENGVITIRDLIPSVKPESVVLKDLKPTINVFGINQFNNIGSFVKKFNINGSIPKDMMTQIVIGATATGNSITSNSTGLAGYNRGLIDAFKPNVRSGLDNVKSNDDTLAGIFTNKVKEPFQEVYNFRRFTTEFLNSLKEGAKTFFPLLLGAYSNKNLVTSTFLPFDMSLEIDGLSGFVVFNAIRVNEDILPVSYQNQGTSLMLSGMDQQIDDSGWKTSLSCITFSDPETILGSGFESSELTPTEIEAWLQCTKDYLNDKIDSKFDPSDTCKGKEFTGLTLRDPKGKVIGSSDRAPNLDRVWEVYTKDLELTNPYVFGGFLVSAWKEKRWRHGRENCVTPNGTFNYSDSWNGPEYGALATFGYVWGPNGYLAERGGAKFDSVEKRRAEWDRLHAKCRDLYSTHGWEVANTYYCNYTYTVCNQGLDFWSFHFPFEVHQKEEFLLNPEGIYNGVNYNTSTEAGTGYKYRGGGFIQLTGPHQYYEAGVNLARMGLIRDEKLLWKYPDLVNDGVTLSDLGAPSNSIIRGDEDYLRAAASVYGVFDKLIRTLGGDIKDGKIVGKTATREEVMNRINCVDDPWIGNYLMIWATTGMARDYGGKKKRVNGKSKKFYVDNEFNFDYNKSGIFNVSP